MSTKNVLALHDLSGFGRCALSVIIPTLSAMGVQVTAVPTAVMSTHTGGFTGFTFTDMTDTMTGAAEHYKSLGIDFDAVYPGFLASEKQIDVVKKIMDMNPDALKFVDPVMGDDGVMYKTYTKSLCDGIRELSREADVITPNVTEAYLLLDEPYESFENLSKEDATLKANRLLFRLSRICKGDIVITGIEYEENGIKNVGCAVKQSEMTELFMSQKEHKNYPGTGDIFSSVVLGNLLNGKDIFESAKRAVEFTHDVISETIKEGTPQRNGVQLEKNLYKLF